MLELKRLSETIDSTLLEGALNKVEFTYRTEIGSYNNKGLANFSMATKVWIYDQDPLEMFNFDVHFSNLRKKVSEGYFENFIKLNFLQNNRTLSLTMIPDKDLLAEQAKREEIRLDEYKKTLSEEELEELIKNNEKLKISQNQPDSEENLKTLPTLKLTDLDKKAREYPITVLSGEYEKTFVQGKEEGVVEVQLAFDISQVPQDLIPYLSLYSQALLNIGTFDKTPQELASLLDLYFGKISTAILATKRIDTGNIVKKFVISFKTLQQNADKAFDLLDDILFSVDFVNETKLKEIVLEEKDNLESDIIDSGHIMALGFAQSAFREDALYKDATSGIMAYAFYKDLAKNFDDYFVDTTEKLVFIHALLLSKNVFSANFGSDTSKIDYYSVKLDEFYKKLHTKQYDLQKILLPSHKIRAFIIPAKVNYVGMAYNAFTVGLNPKSLIWPVNTLLRLDYLWNEIRVKGGAYGATSQFMEDGLVSLASYRDPNIELTLNTYEQVGNFLSNLVLSPDLLENFKISSINRFQPHINSDKIVSSTWTYYLQGYTLESRQVYKDTIYNLTQKDLNNLGETLNKAKDLPRNVVVLGGKETISTYKFDEVIELF
jgi:Zn-dependent M16 (insulinase) family peptidase